MSLPAYTSPSLETAAAFDDSVHAKGFDAAAVERIGRDLLLALGEDPDREGLIETPRRFAGAWLELMQYEPGNMDTTFESVTSDQMVVVSGIRVWSVCEHHLLPFWCDYSIGYVPGRQVLGLSKFARIAHHHAHSLQLQERLTQQIADTISQLAATQDVAVFGTGVHLCMVMRGIKTPGRMSSSIMRGVFRYSEAARAEFFSLLKHNPSQDL